MRFSDGLFKIFVGYFLLLGLVACGGTASPKIQPGLTSSIPLDGASDVAVDGNLRLGFSRAMDKTSLVVRLEPAADLGAAIWDDRAMEVQFTLAANLAPDTAYTLSLSGKDTAGTPLSKSLTFHTAARPTPDISPPAVPANFSAKPADAAVLLSWSGNSESDLAGYTVFWGTSAAELKNSSSVDQTQTSTTITGLSNGTTYFFAVSAKNTAGAESAKTDPVSATPSAPPAPGDTTPPAVPKGLELSAGDGRLTASWTENTEPDLKGYNVYLGTSANNLSAVAFVAKGSAKSTSKKISGLNNGSSYFVSVDAEDSSGNKSNKAQALSALPVDQTPPILVSSDPKDGAKDIALYPGFTFKFSEPMRRETLEITPTCPPNTGCPEFNAPSWSNGDKTVDFPGATGLSSGVSYALTVRAKDLAGNALQTTLHFTTVSAPTGPTLVSSNPANNAKDVNLLLPSVSFTFSQPMQTNALQVNCSFVLAGNSAQCGVEGSGYLDAATWSNGDKTATFARKGGELTAGTGYRLEILGAKSKTGKDLSGTKVVVFNTFVIPKLVSSIPANHATVVAINTDLVFKFNKPIDTKSFYTGQTCSINTVCLDTKIPLWTDSDKTLTFKNTKPLTPDQDYALTLFAKDKLGNPVGQTTITFTTAGTPPKPTYFFPANAATNISGQTSIDLAFSKPMNLDSLKAALTGTVTVGSSRSALVIKSISQFTSPYGYGYIFYPQTQFDIGTVVQWELGTAATDAKGNHLEQPLISSFSTSMLKHYTVTVPANLELTGSVRHACHSIGGCNNVVFLNSKVTVGIQSVFGDSFPERGFYTFDFPPEVLNAMAITGAVLNLKRTYSFGDPFAPNNLGTMALERIDYGSELDSGDFERVPLNCNGNVCSVDFLNESQADGPVDVLKFILANPRERNIHGDHAQFRLRFANTDSHNGSKNAYLSYDPGATLTLEYLAP